MPEEKREAFLSVGQVLERLGLKDKCVVLDLIHAGHLRAVNVSTGPKRPTWRISPEDFNRFLEARQAVPRVTEKKPRRSKAFSGKRFF
jgi:hypothetical protein